jgi:hypothetical protein
MVAVQPVCVSRLGLTGVSGETRRMRCDPSWVPSGSSAKNVVASGVAIAVAVPVDDFPPEALAAASFGAGLLRDRG